MRPIQFIDGSTSKHVQNELSNLCLTLGQSGIVAHWCRSVKDALPGAILLLHDPVDQNTIPEGFQVLGQRTLNRRQRLVIAEKCGLSVPRWCSLEKQDDIALLFDEWDTAQFLYKADWSYSRGGIRLMTPNNLVWLNKFNPYGDVFMEVLGGCPHTFKVDVFFDRIIANRILFTRSVFDRKFGMGFTGRSTLGEIPAIEPQLRALGREVFNYGVGLMNARGSIAPGGPIVM